jgi:hypothetical protein
MQFQSDTTINDALVDDPTPSEVISSLANDLESDGLDASSVRTVANNIGPLPPGIGMRRFLRTLGETFGAKPWGDSPADQTLKTVMTQFAGRDPAAEDEQPGWINTAGATVQMALNNQTPLDNARIEKLVDEFFKKKPIVNEGSERSIAAQLQERSTREDEAREGARATARAQANAGKRIRLEQLEAARTILNSPFGDD